MRILLIALFLAISCNSYTSYRLKSYEYKDKTEIDLNRFELSLLGKGFTVYRSGPKLTTDFRSFLFKPESHLASEVQLKFTIYLVKKSLNVDVYCMQLPYGKIFTDPVEDKFNDESVYWKKCYDPELLWKLDNTISSLVK